MRNDYSKTHLEGEFSDIINIKIASDPQVFQLATNSKLAVVGTDSTMKGGEILDMKNQSNSQRSANAMLKLFRREMKSRVDEKNLKSTGQKTGYQRKQQRKQCGRKNELHYLLFNFNEIMEQKRKTLSSRQLDGAWKKHEIPASFVLFCTETIDMSSNLMLIYMSLPAY